MQERDLYRSVKISRGNLIDRIKNKNQADWILVCKKLGILVDVESGRGSHAAAYKNNCPRTNRDCCIVTLVRNIYPSIQRDIFKKILAHGLHSGLYSEDDIWRALGVL